MVCCISHGLLPRKSKDAIASEAYKLATLGQVIMVNIYVVIEWSSVCLGNAGFYGAWDDNLVSQL